MNSCRPKTGSPGGAAQGLDEIVQSYLRHNAPGEKRYLRFYAIQRTLPDAISKAALAAMPDGTRFSHQRRIPTTVLIQARDALLKLNYRGLETFTDLYEMVAGALRPIAGIGLLTIYDTAHRLGAFLKLSPECVYLHAGVRVGAKALGLQDWKDKLPMNAFPAAFQKLRPEQVEDCLCIYKSDLERWARKQRAAKR